LIIEPELRLFASWGCADELIPLLLTVPERVDIRDVPEWVAEGWTRLFPDEDRIDFPVE
jgi:hypothetical protein